MCRKVEQRFIAPLPLRPISAPLRSKAPQLLTGGRVAAGDAGAKGYSCRARRRIPFRLLGCFRRTTAKKGWRQPASASGEFSTPALRRYFITSALRLGINVTTLAAWQGHRDGGALVLKTYGDEVHLERSLKMAALWGEAKQGRVRNRRRRRSTRKN